MSQTSSISPWLVPVLAGIFLLTANYFSYRLATYQEAKRREVERQYRRDEKTLQLSGDFASAVAAAYAAAQARMPIPGRKEKIELRPEVAEELGIEIAPNSTTFRLKHIDESVHAAQIEVTRAYRLLLLHAPKHLIEYAHELRQQTNELIRISSDYKVKDNNAKYASAQKVFVDAVREEFGYSPLYDMDESPLK